MDVMDRIDQAVKENPVVIFMKGSPQMPMCGYSSRTAQVMMEAQVPFAYVNVLTDPEIFENLPRYANWPTFPQVYISGELVGGCDITLDLAAKGDLKRMMEQAAQGAGDAGEASGA